MVINSNNTMLFFQNNCMKKKQDKNKALEYLVIHHKIKYSESQGLHLIATPAQYVYECYLCTKLFNNYAKSPEIMQVQSYFSLTFVWYVK